MRRQFLRSIAAVITVAAAVALWSTAIAGQGQPPLKAPRTSDGQPDISGIWQVLNSANWDIEDHGVLPAPYHNLVGVYLAQPPGLGVVEGGAIPYKPEALARRKELFEGRLMPDPLGDDLDPADPESKCFQVPPPRAHYIGSQFQIFQTKNTVLMTYEYAGSTRMLYLDKTRKNYFEIDTPMGQSIGRWEGDTLVIDTRGFSAPIRFDRAGNFASEAAIVTERFTRTSSHHIMYEATIEDPSVFIRPWKMSMPLYRRMEPRAQLLEFQCIPAAEEYIYGKLKRPSSR